MALDRINYLANENEVLQERIDEMEIDKINKKTQKSSNIELIPKNVSTNQKNQYDCFDRLQINNIFLQLFITKIELIRLDENNFDKNKVKLSDSIDKQSQTQMINDQPLSISSQSNKKIIPSSFMISHHHGKK